MHDIFKKLDTISDSGAALCPYLFPEIMKHAVTASEKVSETPDSSFQRIFLSSEAIQKSFKSDYTIDLQAQPEPENTQEACQKIIDEMTQANQQKEADAYQRGIQEGQETGYAKGQKEGYAAGQNEGYAKGYETGAAESLKNIESALHMLQTAVKDFHDLQKKIELQAEKEIVTLSLAIARKIILQEPSINPEMIVRTVQNALTAVTVHPPLSIRIHPSDAGHISEHRAQLPVEGEVSFIADAAITPGGCVIEGASGDIDDRIETQIQIIEETFAPRLEKIDKELAEPV